MKKDTIKQFVLTNGHEIICDVIEWTEKEFTEIVVRNCMEIISVINDNQKIYIFKPWMQYQESHSDLVVVNSDHIISTAIPNKYLIWQYEKAVMDMHETSTQRAYEFKKERTERYQEMIAVLNTISERESYNRIYDDSDVKSNIIQFPIF